MLSRLFRTGLQVVYAGLISFVIWVASLLIVPVDFAATTLFLSGAVGFSYLVWRYRQWIDEHHLEGDRSHYIAEKTLTSFGIGSFALAVAMTFFIMGQYGEFPAWEDFGIGTFFLSLIFTVGFFGYHLGKKPKANRMGKKKKNYETEYEDQPKLKNSQLNLDADIIEDEPRSLGDLLDDSKNGLSSRKR